MVNVTELDIKARTIGDVATQAGIGHSVANFSDFPIKIHLNFHTSVSLKVSCK